MNMPTPAIRGVVILSSMGVYASTNDPMNAPIKAIGGFTCVNAPMNPMNMNAMEPSNVLLGLYGSGCLP